MTHEEIEQKVKEVIAMNSRYSVDEIKTDDVLDKFISSSSNDRLGRELQSKFWSIDSGRLTNDLFVVLKKVSDVITRIESYYPQSNS